MWQNLKLDAKSLNTFWFKDSFAFEKAKLRGTKISKQVFQTLMKNLIDLELYGGEINELINNSILK